MFCRLWLWVLLLFISWWVLVTYYIFVWPFDPRNVVYGGSHWYDRYGRPERTLQQTQNQHTYYVLYMDSEPTHVPDWYAQSIQPRPNYGRRRTPSTQPPVLLFTQLDQSPPILYYYSPSIDPKIRVFSGLIELHPCRPAGWTGATATASASPTTSRPGPEILEARGKTKNWGPPNIYNQ